MLGGLLSTSFADAIKLFLLSMVPIIELRGAIPVGAACGVPWLENLVICCVANMLPVPFVILFIRSIFHWMKRHGVLVRLITWMEQHVLKKEYMLRKYSLIGLCLLVAIPIPGTGAWTGAMLAGLLDIRFRQALPVIALGVLIAGLVMCGVSYGAIGVAGLFGL